LWCGQRDAFRGWPHSVKNGPVNKVSAATAVYTQGLPVLPLATGILLLTFGAIASERINRAIAALLGAGAMIGLGVVDQSRAIASIDWNTIALLLGTMILVAVAGRSGAFEMIALACAQAVRGHPAGMLVMLQVVTAALSAVLNNVTVVLLIVPVTLAIAREWRIDPYPFLFAEIFASNIGGAATLIGDPPNMLIGSGANLSYNAFLRNLAPIAAATVVVQVAVLHLAWGRKLAASPVDRQRVLAHRPWAAVREPSLLWQTGAVIVAAITGFIFSDRLGVGAGSIAVMAAVLLMALETFGRKPREQSRIVGEMLAQVEWATVLLFIGLFVIVEGVRQAGLIDVLARELTSLTRGNVTVLALAVLWGSAILSALIDNIPFVATMVPLVNASAPDLASPGKLDAVWWSLAIGACFGGNGTLIGASANLTVAGLAERAGHPIGFMRFLVRAFPLMLASLCLVVVVSDLNPFLCTCKHWPLACVQRAARELHIL
jgi:Na+/H+ antiporter NhaD/arsenite permease-like protein